MRTKRGIAVGLCLVLIGLLSACGPTDRQAVQPITGLPEGTDGQKWWNDTIFYQIFVRSFYDSDGDGIGDFNGIVEKLDYLNDGDPRTTTDLGITGIWLMPINPSPSYHGYDVTDYYDVNPDYGTMEDFERLLDECHQRGIRVIMDLVLNHTSSEHPWFQEARTGPDAERRDWYIWSDTDPGYIGPWSQDVWYPSGSAYYYALFWSEMPDLNYTNPDVTEEMEGVARFWLEQVGVDGFRLDAARHLIEEGQNQENTEATHAWWRDFRTMYTAVNADALAVGEIWTNNYAVNDYLQGDELDMAFDFELAKAILDNVRRYDGRAMGGDMKRSFELFPLGSYATFITNHDQERVMSTMFGQIEKAASAGSILLTGPGVPFVYYGEEIGMSGTKPDPSIRTPMQWTADAHGGFTTGTPWEPANQDYSTVNVALELEDPASLLSHYRTLINLRNNHAALRVGEYVQVRAEARELLAFLRISQEEIVLVLINLGGKALSEYTLSLQRSPLSGDYKGVLLLGEGEVAELTVTDSGSFEDYQPVAEIPANGTVIIQLNSK